MKLQLIIDNETNRSSIDASDLVFGRDVNVAVVHQVVNAFMANQRAQSYRYCESGTRSALKKNRAAVSGGGRKPRAQKGSGRARAGTIRSPIFVGGGLTFGSSKPNYMQKINKKMYRHAMCSILSSLRQEERLLVGEVKLTDFKTKTMINWLAQHGFQERTMIVLQDWDEQVVLAARNLPHVTVVFADELNPVLLLKHDTVLIHPEALKCIEEIFV